MSQEVSKIIDQLQVRIDEANKKAESIIQEAETRAKEIINDARNTADKQLKAAEEEIQRREQAHAEKLKQAVRDTLIELKQKTIQSILNKTFDATLTEPLNDPDLIKNTILKMGQEFARKLSSDLRVILGPELFEKLAKTLKQEAHQVLKTGLEVELDRSMKGGFKIGAAKEAYVYDFSTEALVELFSTAYGSQIEAQIFAGAK